MFGVSARLSRPAPGRRGVCHCQFRCPQETGRLRCYRRCSPPPPLRSGNVIACTLAGVKKLNAKNTAGAGASTERFRIGVSDGTHWASVMLATQLNALIANGEIDDHTILRLDDTLNQQVNGKLCAPALSSFSPVKWSRMEKTNGMIRRRDRSGIPISLPSILHEGSEGLSVQSPTPLQLGLQHVQRVFSERACALGSLLLLLEQHHHHHPCCYGVIRSIQSPPAAL